MKSSSTPPETNVEHIQPSYTYIFNPEEPDPDAPTGEMTHVVYILGDDSPDDTPSGAAR